MEGYIEICGKPIEIKSIKDFKVIDVEYIFRPVYREESVKKLLSKSKKYVFESMEPYAAIKSGKRQGGPLGFVKTQKDAHIRYEIINAAGRTMTVYFDEIPVVVYLEDGRKVEVFKDNKEYNIQGRERTPAIEIIEALYIKAKEEYTFYGRDINLFSVISEYSKVKDAVDRFKNRKKEKADDSDQQNNQADNAKENDGFVKDKLKSLKNGAGVLSSKIKEKVKKNQEDEGDNGENKENNRFSDSIRALMDKYNDKG